MLVLGVDVESTGLSVTEDRVIELGAVLWDTGRKVPVQVLNTLLTVECELSPAITKLTGIETADLQKYGRPPAQVFVEFGCLMQQASYMVAHNGTMFDRPIIEAEFARHDIPLTVMHWLDTSVDIEYEEGIKTRKLTHLAAEHGFLNPWSHRAVFDVLTMLKILSMYDIDKVLDYSRMPSVTLVADTFPPWKDPAPEGQRQVDLAKQRGYRWDGDKRVWSKQVKENKLQDELTHGQFPVRQVTA